MGSIFEVNPWNHCEYVPEKNWFLLGSTFYLIQRHIVLKLCWCNDCVELVSIATKFEVDESMQLNFKDIDDEKIEIGKCPLCQSRNLADILIPREEVNIDCRRCIQGQIHIFFNGTNMD